MRKCKKKDPAAAWCSLLIWVAIILLLFSLNACSFRKIQAYSSVQADTAVSVSSISEQSDRYQSHSIRSKDTVIKIGQKIAAGVLKLSDLLPLFTRAGVPVPQTFEAVQPGIKAQLTVNPDSTVRFSATADSLTLIIQGLSEKVDRLSRSITAKKDSTAVAHHTERTTWKEFFKSRDGWRLMQAGAVVVLLIVLIEGISFFKRKLKNK